MQLHLVSRPKKEREKMMNKQLQSYEEDSILERDGPKSDSVLNARRQIVEALPRYAKNQFPIIIH